MFSLHFSDPGTLTHISGSTFSYLNPTHSNSRFEFSRIRTRRFSPWVGSPAVVISSPPVAKLTAVSDVTGKCTDDQPPVCTADELHYVPVSNSDWRLALWRYKPPPDAPRRNHPLLLLSGVATNAIGFDLSPESSFARHMSSQGYDVWTLEVRGAGLSRQRAEKLNSADNRGTNGSISAEPQSAINGVIRESKFSSVKGKRADIVTKSDDSQLLTKWTDTIVRLSEKLSGLLDEGFLVAMQDTAMANQIRDLSQRLVNIVKGQRSASPQYFDLPERLSMTVATIEDFQKQLDLIVKYDWDFDHYLEEDVPAAMEYIRTECKPKDGKLLAVGHSMGGILLYATLSQHGFKRRDSGLASVVTLGSSLDYASSKSSLKLLLPVADPAQALSVPVIPVGAMLAAAHPFSSRLPYILSWLTAQISAQDMMHPKLFEKLVLNNFGTVPTKLLAQLTTAFREGGLRDRSGTFLYKDHLRESNVPVLALAGDQDLICPPEAVYETIKLVPEHLITYKVFGEPGGPHYAHYDLVGGRLAAEQVYPCIVDFLSHHDLT